MTNPESETIWRVQWRGAALSQGGFTLLEVLVALIIFALAFGALASLFQTSLRQSRTAETLLDATALAESQIARFGAELPLKVGEMSGHSSEGLSWNARVDLAAPPGNRNDVALYQITLTVSTTDGIHDHVTLTTLRVGAPP